MQMSLYCLTVQRDNMSAAKYDLTIDQGSNFSLTLNVKEDGVNKNLDGWNARGSIRETLEGAEVDAFDFTDSTFDAAGNLVMKLSHNETTLINAGNYYYDVEVFNTSTDKATRIIQGKITVTRQVTR